jgi:hypothetical protein
MKKIYFLIMLLSISGLYSCKKNNDSISKPKKVDIYVAGVENNGSFDVAKYWKNGIPVNLSDGHSQANANSIVVSDTDVYVAGWVRNESTQTSIAVYWKNGIAVNLTDGSHETYATSIAVSGNDVYVTGTQTDVDSPSIAKYWKNGSLVSLTDLLGANDNNVAISIAVSGADVYVAGYKGRYVPENDNGNSSSTAEYWQNGSVVNLATPSAPYSDYMVSSITVSGNDVYVAGTTGGYFSSIATYWKNGNPVKVADSSNLSNASSIVLAANDVYMSGSEYDYDHGTGIATYWKNGTVVDLTDGSHDAYANSIAVSGNDVYVAGVEYEFDDPNIFSGPSIATYWKNGGLVNLTDGSKYAVANSIFISTH